LGFHFLRFWTHFRVKKKIKKNRRLLFFHFIGTGGDLCHHRVLAAFGMIGSRWFSIMKELLQGTKKRVMLRVASRFLE
jgi:hypothetical protein